MRTRTLRAKAMSLLVSAALIGAACGDDDDDDAAPEETGAAAETSAGGVATTAGGVATTAAGPDTTATATTAGDGTATTAAGTTAPAGTTAETSPPTAPPRGDADLVIWADDTRTPIIEQIAAPFAEENGITVAVQELEFGQIREQLSLTAPGGDGPDIIIGAHDWLGELVTNGVLEPLDLSAIADGFDPVAIEAFTYEGQTYGLPYAVENIALVRNTDLAPEMPATFEEMVQLGTDFKAQYPDDPSYLGLALQVGPEGDGYHYHPILTAFGGYIFAQNPDGTFNPDDLGLDSPGAIEAARFLSEQAEAGLLSADVSYDVMIESFGTGKAPFAITGPWAISQEGNGFKATGVPYEVTPIPAREGGDPPQVFVGVQGFMISSFSEQKDLATSFVLDFMSQEETQLALFEAGGRPPALTSAFEQVRTDPDIAGFGESAQAGIPQPAIPEMGSVWTELGLAEVNVLRGADPEAEFTAAAEAIRSDIGG
jgi:arabinogalactan oligomer/maltooligosaccharide transport system substrate-binding protein